MYKGSCLCGAVHYEISGPVAYASNCWCTMCQKQHGAASGPYINVALADYRVVTGADRVREYASSSGVWRGFCQDCGSSLTWRSNARTDRIAVTLGTLDTPYAGQLAHEYFPENKPHWLG